MSQVDVSPVTGSARHRHRWNSVGARSTRTAWLFMTPSIVVLAGFMVYPILRSIYLSFTNFNVFQPPKWTGLANYAKLIHDGMFWNALKNTAEYAIIVAPITVVLAVALAILLNQKLMARGFTRTAIFLPFIVSMGIVSFAWLFMLDPTIGFIPYWLGKLGIPTAQGWLSSPKYAMPAIIVVGIWKQVGFYMVMFLAGLQSIPEELYEAAKLEGAGRWKTFTNVTWPLLSNQTMLVMIMATVASIQVFDQIYIMTQGGPAFATETMVSMLYRVGFQSLNFGYASAVSWALMLVVFVLSILQYGYFNRRQVAF